MSQNDSPAEPVTFEDVFAEQGPRVLRLLRFLGVRESDLDDVAQEVWSVVHRALLSYASSKATMGAWIGRITRNAARTWGRTRRRRPEFSTSTEQELSDPRTAETVLADARRGEALWLFFEQAIPNEDQREAFLFHDVDELTIEEVADATGSKPSTVKWRLAMARSKLKAAQEAMSEEERRRLLAVVPLGSVDAFAKAMRETPVPDEEVARVWDRVSERIAREGGSIHAPLGSPATAPLPADPLGYTFTSAQIVGALAGVFLLGAIAGAGALYAFLSRDKTSMTAVDVEIRPAPIPTPQPLPEPAPTASAAPKMTPSVTSARASGWQEEALLLDRARRADPLEAIRLTDQHVIRFRNSRHAAEREEIAIGALVQLGRRAEAEERAAKLVRWAPSMDPVMKELLGRSFL